MAKRKKTEPELPLFDLPLRPEADDEAHGTPADDFEDAAAAEPVAADATPSSPVQPMLPDLVIEPPTRGRGEGATLPKDETDPREVAVTPRARLATPGQGGAAALDTADGGYDDDDESATLSWAAPLGERALAGLADLGINVLMLAFAALASHFVGVDVSLDLWPPFVGLSLVLSFLYWIIPLAFWGQTPGMAWLGNIARSFDDEPLSFGQALLRWLGAWITAGLLGLPQLLALGGRSLTDRLSDSKTLVLPDGPDD